MLEERRDHELSRGMLGLKSYCMAKKRKKSVPKPITREKTIGLRRGAQMRADEGGGRKKFRGQAILLIEEKGKRTWGGNVLSTKKGRRLKRKDQNGGDGRR